ncbi:MAG TPA: GGDEF domain-containing protein [Candidatus Dormibacteraeota bacterium]|nr:GGDEF domain-containing protein [Candidatus Dormibacteraeota bacterium]
MQQSQPADRAAVRAGQADASTSSDAARALGMALALRAEECSELSHERLRSYPWAGRQPSAEYALRVRGINWFATVLIARWIAYGEVVSDEEMEYISERGELAASEQLAIVNITRAYLIWRDTVLELLKEEAGRLDTPRDIVAGAVRAVRTSSDAALVHVARSYDTRLSKLAQDLEVERKALLHQALHDPLTGLPNRVLLYDRIDQAAFAAKRNRTTFALLAIDLDGFKNVNDRLGHRCGDVVLQATAARLVESVRESDTVARLGGDEFLVLLPGVDHEPAQRMAAKLQRVLQLAIDVEGNAVTVGASLGVSTYPADGQDVHTLLSAADKAMYTAKRRANRRR